MPVHMCGAMATRLTWVSALTSTGTWPLCSRAMRFSQQCFPSNFRHKLDNRDAEGAGFPAASLSRLPGQKATGKFDSSNLPTRPAHDGVIVPP